MNENIFFSLKFFSRLFLLLLGRNLQHLLERNRKEKERRKEEKK